MNERRDDYLKGFFQDRSEAHSQMLTNAFLGTDLKVITNNEFYDLRIGRGDWSSPVRIRKVSKYKGGMGHVVNDVYMNMEDAEKVYAELGKLLGK